jgi:hypothetical protein
MHGPTNLHPKLYSPFPSLNKMSSNPLRTLGPITEHPSPTSSVSSGYLSSVLSNLEEYEDLRMKVDKRLDLYKPVEDDDTTDFLRIVSSRLPKKGNINLMYDIISLKDDSKLRQLRNHFVDAILKPSKIKQVAT